MIDPDRSARNDAVSARASSGNDDRRGRDYAMVENGSAEGGSSNAAESGDRDGSGPGTERGRDSSADRRPVIIRMIRRAYRNGATVRIRADEIRRRPRQRTGGRKADAADPCIARSGRIEGE